MRFHRLSFFCSGFFDTLAEFIQARNAPLLPCPDVAETICLLASNAFCTLMFKTDPLPVEKIFKKWESCGMLKEYIRCTTIPQAADAFMFPPGILKVYEELSNNCTLLVKKKFKEGEPCGDVITAILTGKDGSRIKRMQVIHKLEEIASYAKILQPEECQLGYDGEGNKICRKCNKYGTSVEFQKSLMKCSRCKSVFYCSKVSH